MIAQLPKKGTPKPLSATRENNQIPRFTSVKRDQVAEHHSRQSEPKI